MGNPSSPDPQVLAKIGDRMDRAVEQSRQWALHTRSAAMAGEPTAIAQTIEVLLEHLGAVREAAADLRAELGLGGSSGPDAELPRPRMMIVDDDPSIREELAALLEDFDPVQFEDGEQALEALAAGEHFDLVLCDIVMKGATGLDVYERVRDHHPALARRFLFMTRGEFSPLMREIVGGLSPDVLVLHKPLDPKMVRWVVEHQIRDLV